MSADRRHEPCVNHGGGRVTIVYDCGGTEFEEDHARCECGWTYLVEIRCPGQQLPSYSQDPAKNPRVRMVAG